MVPIVDIIIGVIMLVFLIMGLSRGFIKTVLALLGTIVALVLAYFLAKPFLNFFNGIVDVTTPLNNTLTNWIGSFNPLLNETIDLNTIQKQLTDFATSISLPETLYRPIVDAIVSYVSNPANAEFIAGKSLAGIIAPFFTNAILLTCSMLVLFVLLRVALYLIEKVLDWTILKINVIRALDKLLGLVFGAVQGLVVILLCFTLISFLATNPESSVRQAINDSAVGKVIYDANPLPGIITQNLNIEQILKNIFNPDQDEEEEEEPGEEDKDQNDTPDTPQEQPGDTDPQPQTSPRLVWSIVPGTAPLLG